MGLRFLSCLLGLVALASPLWADSCALRNGLVSVLNAQTGMIRDIRSGQTVSVERIAQLRQDRADLAEMAAGDADATRAAAFVLNDLAAMDPILAAGTLRDLERHLASPERRQWISGLERAFASLRCQSTGPITMDVGDLGLPILPNGRLGTAAMTASTILVFSGLWAVYGIRTRAEAKRRRYLVALRTVMTVDDDRLTVRINNISRTGAQINMAGEALPIEGRKVALALDDTETAARVVWQKDAIAGMAFDKCLEADLFQSLTRSKQPQRPGRIGRRTR